MKISFRKQSDIKNVLKEMKAKRDVAVPFELTVPEPPNARYIFRIMIEDMRAMDISNFPVVKDDVENVVKEIAEVEGRWVEEGKNVAFIADDKDEQMVGYGRFVQAFTDHTKIFDLKIETNGRADGGVSGQFNFKI